MKVAHATQLLRSSTVLRFIDGPSQIQHERTTQTESLKLNIKYITIVKISLPHQTYHFSHRDLPTSWLLLGLKKGSSQIMP